MIRLYHVSMANFDEFKISEDLLRTNKDNLAEGMGIYFSDKESFCENYPGKYIYVVDVETKNIWDFSKRITVENILKRLSKQIGINLFNYVSKNSLYGVLDGSISVTQFYKEIQLSLDSDCEFYESYGEQSEEIFEKVQDEYQKILNERLFIKYFDIGYNSIIYICNHDENKIPIIEKRTKED